MLTRLTFHNFRSHADLTIKLGPLTFITAGADGNDFGKTNILRGIDWWARNAGPSCEKMCRHFTDEMWVEGETSDGVIVRRSWKRGENRYTITRPGCSPEVYDKVGKLPLAEVTRVLGFPACGELDLQFQGARRKAPLDLGPSAFAGYLAGVARAGTLEQASKDAARDARSLRERLKEAESTQATYDQMVEETARFASLPRLLDLFEQVEQDGVRLRQRSMLLNSILVRARRPIPEVPEGVDRAVSHLELQVAGLPALRERLRTLTSIRTRAKRAVPPEVPVAAQELLWQADQDIARLVQQQQRRTYLTQLRARYMRHDQQAQNLSVALAGEQSELAETLDALGVCPLCGRSK